MFVLSEHIDNRNIGIDISYKSNTMLDRNWQWIGRERWIGSLVVKAVVLKFTHPDASFGQYTFVLSISTFDKKPLISGTSNNILDRNRHQIGWERNELEFRLLQHWSSVHSKHRKFYASWWRIWSILTKHRLRQLFLKYNVQKFSTKWMLARRTVRASFLNEKQLLEWKEQNITFMVNWNYCYCYCYCCRFCRLFCYHGCVLVVVTAVPAVSAVIFLVLILLFFRYGYCGCKTFSSLVFLALRLNLNMHCLIWNVKRSCLLKTSHHLTLWISFFASR